MLEDGISTECMTNLLINRIDRRNIFPPLRNVYKEVKRSGFCCNLRVISKATSILWSRATREEKSVYKRLCDDIADTYFIIKSYN
ncbi:hypothetical protein GLOIN_2v1774217 [Rhizophagus clarus]|uniref:Uncharacterized protein n=1 Tax=Rhizophagus clarus TaxID=94130 RepID=A0A8H3LN45_9GLOM|nr:hypothetical protein GLOIN_2v1774217 [Rhizophagus clarus]